MTKNIFFIIKKKSQQSAFYCHKTTKSQECEFWNFVLFYLTSIHFKSESPKQAALEQNKQKKEKCKA